MAGGKGVRYLRLEFPDCSTSRTGNRRPICAEVISHENKTDSGCASRDRERISGICARVLSQPRFRIPAWLLEFNLPIWSSYDCLFHKRASGVGRLYGNKPGNS